MDRGAWRAAVHGVTQRWTQLNRPHSTAQAYMHRNTPEDRAAIVNGFSLRLFTMLTFLCLFEFSDSSEHLLLL